jgi:hypothetical protein
MSLFVNRENLIIWDRWLKPNLLSRQLRTVTDAWYRPALTLAHTATYDWLHSISLRLSRRIEQCVLSPPTLHQEWSHAPSILFLVPFRHKRLEVIGNRPWTLLRGEHYEADLGWGALWRPEIQQSIFVNLVKKPLYREFILLISCYQVWRERFRG